MKAPRPHPHRHPATLLRLALLGAAAACLLPPWPLHGADVPATDATPITTNATTATSAPAPDTNSASPLLATNTNAPASPDSAADRVDRSDRTDRGDRDRSDRRSRRSGGPDRRRGDRGESSSSGSADAGTNTTSTLPPSDFAAFKIITDRNIFNPNRGRGSGRGDRETARKPVQVDLITLVGALSYAKGDFAFFDGSSAQFRKVLKCGDSIAGFTVKSIAPSTVQIENAGKTNDLKIGSQLRREDEGEWQFIARSDAAALTGTSSGSSSGGGSGNGSGTGSVATSTSGGSESGGAANDILERLRKKREQENK